MQRALAVLAMAAVAGACSRQPAGGVPLPEPDRVQTAAGSAATDTTSLLVPAGFGTLRQDDIALKWQVGAVQVRALPLDENILRVLSVDSYRALHELAASRHATIESLARRHGLRDPSLWYVSFSGVQPDARYTPLDLVIVMGGRQFRPIETIALTPGFGNERLAQRETQTAIYLYDDAADANQPLTVNYQGAPNDSWPANLQRIERERALVRSRAR